MPAMFADVRRGLTIAAVVDAATVKDTDGNEIDTSEFFGRPEAAAEATAETADAADVDADDTGDADADVTDETADEAPAAAE
jgi:trigger factor